MTKARANCIIKDADSDSESWKKLRQLIQGFLNGENYIENERSQNYLMIQPICKTFTIPIVDTETFTAW